MTEDVTYEDLSDEQKNELNQWADNIFRFAMDMAEPDSDWITAGQMAGLAIACGAVAQQFEQIALAVQMAGE